MPRHDPRLALRHMLDHAREAVEMAHGRTRDDLYRDRQFNLSLVRLLEIVGEAANRVPSAEQSKLPKIPWPEVVSLRNRLIHAYDSVDLEIVWQVVCVDLPPLIDVLERALQAPSGSEDTQVD